MAAHNGGEGNQPVLDLGQTLTIGSVAELHKEAAALFASAGKLVLKGDRIEKVDTAGIQLLVAMLKEAAERDMEIQWDGIPERLRQDARQLGLQGVLNL